MFYIFSLYYRLDLPMLHFLKGLHHLNHLQQDCIHEWYHPFLFCTNIVSTYSFYFHNIHIFSYRDPSSVMYSLGNV